MRTFIATEIPDHQKKIIWNFMQELKKMNLPIRWVDYENLHITLKFLGEIDENKLSQILPVLSEISNRTKSFTMQLENFGCFPSIRNPRVLWIGVSQGSDEIVSFATALENGFVKYGFKKENKKFHPHLTIGRIKTFCKIDDIINTPIKTDPFTISEMTLFKSTLLPSGPVYERIKIFPFSTST
ncbi:MAG: RNA 2',3'-cyclic phosphodiesterase [bacterium]